MKHGLRIVRLLAVVGGLHLVSPSQVTAQPITGIHHEVQAYVGIVTQLLHGLVQQDIPLVDEALVASVTNRNALLELMTEAENRLLGAVRQGATLAGGAGSIEAREPVINAMIALDQARFSVESIIMSPMLWFETGEETNRMESITVIEAIRDDLLALPGLVDPLLAEAVAVSSPAMLRIDLSSRETAPPGELVLVRLTVENVGEETAEAVTLRFNVEVDGVTTEQTTTLPDIPPGTNEGFGFYAQMPDMTGDRELVAPVINAIAEGRNAIGDSASFQMVVLE
jgi:hypothetical protein